VVTTVVSTSCLSAGEALRLIDQKDIIKGDFILVSGDTVANLNLAPVLEAHRARRAADKNAIMTMVREEGCKQAQCCCLWSLAPWFTSTAATLTAQKGGLMLVMTALFLQLMKPVHHPHQRLRMGDSETVVCLDPSTNRLLKYYEVHRRLKSTSDSYKCMCSAGGSSTASSRTVHATLNSCMCLVCWQFAPHVPMMVCWLQADTTVGRGRVPSTFKVDATFFGERDSVQVSLGPVRPRACSLHCALQPGVAAPGVDDGRS
jgi:hypothetical protein